MNQEHEAMMAQIAKQNAEFDAVAKLAEAYQAIKHTAPVDDDYPRVRHQYESAIHTLITKMDEYGRFNGMLLGNTEEALPAETAFVMFLNPGEEDVAVVCAQVPCLYDGHALIISKADITPELTRGLNHCIRREV